MEIWAFFGQNHATILLLIYKIILKHQEKNQSVLVCSIMEMKL